MRKYVLGSLFLALLFILSVVTTSAEEIYVKNKPFEGTVLGKGLSSELSLRDLGAAFDLDVKESEGQWWLGETAIPAREQDGQPFVAVSALKEAGFKVIHSAELGTIDINTGRGPVTAQQERKPMAEIAWGGAKPTLVYFGADW